MSEPTTDKQTWNFVLWIFSTVVGMIGTWIILSGQAQINHRLDVDDAWQLKGTYEAGKEWQTESRELRAFAERLIEHCKTEANGCKLPETLTLIPPSRNAPAMELMVSRTKTQHKAQPTPNRANSRRCGSTPKPPTSGLSTTRTQVRQSARAFTNGLKPFRTCLAFR